MGDMKRAIARKIQDRQDYEAKVRDRLTSTLVIAASIIAALRLAKDEQIGRPSPCGKHSRGWRGTGTNDFGSNRQMIRREYEQRKRQYV